MTRYHYNDIFLSYTFQYKEFMTYLIYFTVLSELLFLTIFSHKYKTITNYINIF